MVPVLLALLALLALLSSSRADFPILPYSPLIYGYNVVTEQSAAPLFDALSTFGVTYTIDKTKFAVLDELAVQNMPGSSTKELQQTFSSAHDLITQTAEQQLGHGEFATRLIHSKFAFNNTKSTTEEFMKHDSCDLSLLSYQVRLYQLSLWPGLPLHADLTDAIQALPSTYDSSQDKAAYRQFIAQYGTHYATQGVFGGSVSLSLAYLKSLSANHTSAWVSRQVSLSVGQLKRSIGMDSSETELPDPLFVAASSSSIGQVGGDVLLHSYAEWLRSVKQQPAALPLELRLQPISDLFPASQSIKKSLVEQAIVDYCVMSNIINGVPALLWF
eukprot:GILK01000531.1.p1 GENE.GILK01000531.1~~GILK01000531.1.p1  ORF type:complete len:330 (-),score=39.42 GILK01000531.1:1114-2103(-)